MLALLTVTFMVASTGWVAGAAAWQDEASVARAGGQQDTGPPEFLDIKELKLGTHRTVFIVFGVDCDACVSSIDFYKRVMSQPAVDGTRVKVQVLTTGGVVLVNEVLSKQEFKPHQVSSYPRMSRLKEVPPEAPSLVVVDSAGKPLKTWRGRLTAQEEEEVLKLLIKLS